MTTTCSRYCSAVGVGLVLFCLAACSEAPHQTPISTPAATVAAQTNYKQHRLPASLREVSGLALTAAGELLAIADEVGIVFQLDLEAGKALPYASFGDPPLAADFEGVAVLDDQLYALTSKGHLLQRSQLDSTADAYRRHKTKLGDHCEFEGLASDMQNKHLWLLCKTTYKKRYKGEVVIFKWDVATDSVLKKETIRLAVKDLGFTKNQNPSGIDLTPDGEEIYIIAAKQRAFVVLDKYLEPLRQGHLPLRESHVQAEGVVVSGAGVYVADEAGGGRQPAVLTHYYDGF